MSAIVELGGLDGHRGTCWSGLGVRNHSGTWRFRVIELDEIHLEVDVRGVLSVGYLANPEAFIVVTSELHGAVLACKEHDTMYRCSGGPGIP